MKIIIYIFFLSILMSSCSNKNFQHRMFYASPALMSSSQYATESKFEFVLDTYKIHLKRSFNDSIGVIIEKGTYLINKNIVTTQVECKLICETSFIDPKHQTPCGRFGTNYENGYFVCSDSLNEDKLSQLKFNKHEFIINRIKGKLILTNKNIPQWKLYEM